MRLGIALASSLLSCVLAACDRSPLDPMAAGGGAGANGDTKVIGASAADPNCSASPASFQTYSDAAELETLLVRRWRRCTEPQLPGEDVGVEFTADGHYYPLTNGPAGTVVRRTGVDYEGTWQYFPVGSMDPFFGGTTTRAEMLLGGVLTDAPTFTNAPRQLRITFSPVPSRYLPLDDL